jgi:hypothetical protein
VGFLREGGDQDPPSIKPPLEVLETFGGAKVSDKRVTSNEARNPKKQTISNATFYISSKILSMP